LTLTAPVADTAVSRRTRSAPVLLGAAGVLLVVSPATRPWSSESGLEGAAAFASSWWVVAHVAAMAGYLLLALAVHRAVPDVAPAARRATRLAARLLTVGAVLVLPYYGAETFALHALGADALATANPSLVDLAAAIRFDPTAATLFAAGLLAIAAGGVALAVGAARAGALLAALPVAAGAVLLLPQYFGTPTLRIAHGLLFGLGAVLLAIRWWRRSS
jgi:hypothetical protein